jgi:hypothetical protein
MKIPQLVTNGRLMCTYARSFSLGFTGFATLDTKTGNIWRMYVKSFNIGCLQGLQGNPWSWVSFW